MTQLDKQATELWRGEFGDAYSDRNALTADYLAKLMKLWKPILDRMDPLGVIVEVGANIGANLWAMRLLTGAVLGAVEPNAKARERLVAGVNPQHAIDAVSTKLPFEDACADLVFTCGVLIHVPPADLEQSCREIHRVSKRYIACVEYFGDREEEVAYRGQAGAMWRRDYGGVYLDLFPDLQLKGYGFAWKRAGYPDNLTWWVFEKPVSALERASRDFEREFPGRPEWVTA